MTRIDTLLKYFSRSGLLALTLALAHHPALLQTVSAQGLVYPKTARVDHVDDYFGTKVPDPYRWLEDDTASVVKAWVQAQNTVTFGYLEKIPFRKQLRARLEALYNYPRYGTPSRTGPYYTFSKNDGLQNQSVLYIQSGIDGKPEVLIDPNALSKDGTVRLGAARLSRDGKYFGYGLSSGGSDWQEFFVMETAPRKPLPDRIRWVKVSGLSWYQNGFFYSRYPAPADTTKALSGSNENHRVYYHRLGTPQEQDELVFEDPGHPKRFHTVWVTDDQRYLLLTISDRSAAGNDGNALYVRDLSKGETGFRPVVTTFKDSYGVLDNVGDKLLVMTNLNAPNWRVVEIDPARPEPANWREILPERPEPLDNASAAGGRLFAIYTKDVVHQVLVYDLNGKLEREIPLPTLGRVGGFGGQRDEKQVFYTFLSFTHPPTTYRYDIATGASSLYRKTEVPFDPGQFETRQVFYPSKDGTKIPMFLVHRKGLALDGQRPTLLYAYGGFNSASAPSFNPLLTALLEQGGVYALANLRGGSEYGEAWHRAGMLLNKQNVFDDFIAAAEWLKANRYTSTERCALQGGSNGGLLVGAVMTQRPELCKVALPAVGVMDMLRYHKFTIGWNWAAEYGSSDDPVHFKNLLSYSPLHNLKAGTSYPATLVTTADHDDRVVPAHSFKFAATLQERHVGPNPVLIRIETRSGHGAVNTAKQLDQTADVYAFLFYNMGVTPAYSALP
ncbi:MAG TPA: prolyl oligopeptidase family serine peptidase [Gemmatimonadales bacterium]|nr:prolyl oligopeptidase family serine peptidase [Gemmatimonadales bacterium]